MPEFHLAEVVGRVEENEVESVAGCSQECLHGLAGHADFERAAPRCRTQDRLRVLSTQLRCTETLFDEGHDACATTGRLEPESPRPGVEIEHSCAAHTIARIER